MYTLKFLPIALLAACLPSAMADRCAALGTIDIRNGTRPPVFEGLFVADHEADKELLSITNEKIPHFGVCAKDYTVATKDTGLKKNFDWGALCGDNYHIAECYGSYGDQKHVVGRNASKSELRWYGVRTDVHSACIVEFDCAKA